MKKLIIFAWIGWLGVNNLAAQTVETQSKVQPSQKTEETTDTSASFTVTKIRQQKRLDQVVVDHKSSGVRDYYDLNDPTTSFGDDSLGSRRVMRTWQFGL